MFNSKQDVLFDNIYFKFDNIFSDFELKTIDSMVTRQPDSRKMEQAEHGRLCISWFEMPEIITEKISDLVHSVAPDSLKINPVPLFVEYSAKYGRPNLTPHMDGDDNDLIFDFQFRSNTSWGIGLNNKVHEMSDNSALAFNPNTNIHWRPVKNFNDGEFVQMLFFRFANSEQKRVPVRRGREDPIYDEIKALRLGAK